MSNRFTSLDNGGIAMLEGASIGLRAHKLTREELAKVAETLNVDLLDCPSASSILERINPGIDKLFEKCARAKLSEGHAENEAHTAASHALSTLKGFVPALEDYGHLPHGKPTRSLHVPGSPAMMLMSVCDAALALASAIEIMAKGAAEREAKVPPPPKREELSLKIPIPGKARPLGDETKSAVTDKLVADILAAEDGRGPQGSSARPTLDADIGFGHGHPIGEVLDSRYPALHSHLMVEGAYMLAKTDGTLLRAEDALESILPGRAWREVRAGGSISANALDNGESDISVLARAWPAGIPTGHELVAIEYRDAAGKPLEGSARASIFGALEGDLPEGTDEIVLRVRRAPGKPAIDPEIQQALLNATPRFSTPTDPYLIAAVDAARAEPDISKRAQIIGQAFAERRSIYSQSPELSELTRAAGPNKLAFLNGFEAGTCITLSFQLAWLMKEAGIPAFVVAGPYICDGKVLGDPGHAHVLCFTPDPLALDPTCWTDKSMAIDGQRLEPGEVAYYQSALAEQTQEEAFEIGRDLRRRTQIRNGGGGQGNEFGHSIADGLSPRREKALDSLLGDLDFSDALGHAWKEITEDKHASRLGQLFEDNPGRFREFLRGEAGESRAKIAETAIQAATACAADPELIDDTDLAFLLRGIDDIRKGHSSRSNGLLAIYEAALDRPGLDPIVLSIVTKMLGSSFEEEWTASSPEKALELFLKGLDKIVESGAAGEELLQSREQYEELMKMIAVAADRAIGSMEEEDSKFQVRALAIRLDAIANLAGIGSVDLLIQQDPRSGQVRPGPIGETWKDLLACSERFGRDFDSVGRISLAVCAEVGRFVAIRAGNPTLHYAIGDALARIRTARFDLDLSASQDAITASFNPSQCELNFPGKDNPVSALLFMGGACPGHSDALACELERAGGLRLAELEPRWAQRNERELAYCLGSVDEARVQAGKVEFNIYIPSPDPAGPSSIRFFEGDLVGSLARLAPMTVRAWAEEAGREACEMIRLFPMKADDPVAQAMSSFKERYSKEFDSFGSALRRELVKTERVEEALAAELKTLVPNFDLLRYKERYSKEFDSFGSALRRGLVKTKRIEEALAAELKTLVPNFDLLRYEAMESVVQAVFTHDSYVRKHQHADTPPSSRHESSAAVQLGIDRALIGLMGSDPPALAQFKRAMAYSLKGTPLAARPPEEQALGLYHALKLWKEEERQWRESCAAYEVIANLQYERDMLAQSMEDALRDTPDADVRGARNTIEYLEQEYAERAKQLRDARLHGMNVAFSILFEIDDVPEMYTTASTSNSREQVNLARFAIQRERSAELSEDKIAEELREIGRRHPNMSKRRDVSTLLAFADDMGPRASSTPTGDFHSHRNYVAGDDLRHMDWNVYGRSDKLVTKQYGASTKNDPNTLSVCIDAAALACTRDSPSNAAKAVLDLAIAAASSGKKLSIEVTFQGSRLVYMSPEQVQADLKRTSHDAMRPGQKILGTLWRAGLDAVGVASSLFDTEPPACQVLSSQTEKAVHKRGDQPLLVIVAGDRSAAKALERSAALKRPAAILEF